MRPSGILKLLALAVALCCGARSPARAQTASQICPRPPAGSEVSEPIDLRSQNGVLNVEFTYRSDVDENGRQRFCYLYGDGTQAPNLRLNPGDLLVLQLRNALTSRSGQAHQHSAENMATARPCASPRMSVDSTNLHFHGLSVPPVCHQDDVLRTAVSPSDPPFEYRLRIPANQPPGLYWYHPHVHGFTKDQVLGGASGALIVEGIERQNLQLAGLPERVFIIRDQELLHPDAEPAQSSGIPAPPVLRDAEGDILNTGTGGGKPAKDLSINFVPVPYPDYPAALIRTKPSERQLWRVLNASAVTYLDLQLVFDGVPQVFGVVSLDGVPINEDGAGNRILWDSHIILPPAGRIEFIMKGPPEGAQALFVTRTVDTGPAGENDPPRPLATIVSRADAPEPRSALSPSPAHLTSANSVWLGKVKPVRERKLYFSEKPSNPSDLNSPAIFYLTVDGQAPAPFDPHASLPNIVARQGDVEDWIIENRSTELHAFHIHQIHFLLTEWNGVPVSEPFLRDTINVAYWDGQSPQYPSVKLRMDFRDPNIVGTFVYHCHLLEHEDGGMMGTIRVDPAPKKP
jgi:FtsP/CotA-like multicopper oxidase with cupredoxin domain